VGASTGLSAGEQQMLTDLDSWIAAGSHRIRAHHGDAQYAYPAGPAIMDELEPHLVVAFFNSVFCADPNNCTTSEVNSTRGLASGYAEHPMGWTDLPSGRNGSSYDGGWEGYLLKALRQLRRQAGDTTDPAMVQPFSAAMMSHLCGGGGCKAAIVKAIQETYVADSAANGGSANPDTWTISENQAYCASNGCPTQMPAYDNITLRAVGLVTEPDLDWQNRPTFQQVVDFPTHRPRLSQVALASVIEGDRGGAGVAVSLFPLGLGALSMLGRRRRRHRARG
jgi:hypothetical protein